MRYFFLLTLITVFAPDAFSAWKESTIRNADRLLDLCSYIYKDEVVEASEGEYKGARIFSNKGATVTICYYDEPRSGKLEAGYAIKYSPSKHAKFETLHSDAQVMAWGAQYKVKKDTMTVDLKWPNSKDQRKIREITLKCGKTCTKTEKCEIEKLKSDLKTKALLLAIKPFLKSSETRGSFIMSEKQGDVRMLDQLFAEALTGNKEAVSALEKLGEGQDAGSGETIATYNDYVNELKTKDCKWK